MIYGVANKLPMGGGEKRPGKNYYLNIGGNQGIKVGSHLEVYRALTRQSPFNNKESFQYKIPIGQVEVIHVEDRASIGVAKLFKNDKRLQLEIDDFIVGDTIQVKVD